MIQNGTQLRKMERMARWGSMMECQPQGTKETEPTYLLLTLLSLGNSGWVLA